MHQRALRCFVFATCALLAPWLAGATSPDLTRSAEQPMFAAAGAPGMVIAVVDGDTVSIHGYGETRPGSKQLPDAHSLLHIGSLSKLLAADLMVKLAAQDALRLTDPLQRYAPDGMRLPVSGRPITLFDLATHTSGLPRQADLPAGALPYAKARWIWLQQQKTLSAPGHVALYSNLAFDFLADALGKAAGSTYEQALQHYVTQPLGMRDTTATPSAEQCARLLAGRDATPCTSASDNAGSGSMYASAADMAAWMKQQLGLGQQGVDPQTAISQAIYFQRQSLADVQGMDHAGHADGLGLGWVLLAASAQQPAILEKTGGYGGFMSYMALAPGQKIGVFVAVTRMDLPALHAITTQVNALVAKLTEQAHHHGA
ncbi:D-alanyl-D-alanine-carboxypeptidase/endopeptidase AmpH [Dyella acidiphila]|uniref:D-alanyl-D-alanine-carboxypeptidase/endopeptidase AmpH n=1 Tax=Dyella acidiphila TaxID=2775866 RepID=A0ABR9GFW8_9GAMM|nr:D-alanyl-D-alanine-carboxypeptidase/endopeptidase AmpH [Dyella acidiphila]MBE1162947.1 D-alanyl-D-alanine-carboxypeptidase/endopeptidase AmpH [Dyella acidiphila]